MLLKALMNPPKYTRKEVEKSFRKFRDISSDLANARHETWGIFFEHLIEHCRRDRIMRVVLEPLGRNTNIDVERWYRQAMTPTSSGVGSGRYTLPYDDEDRTALLYQFFELVIDNSLDLAQFCLNVYGLSSFQEMTRVLNDELVAKFTREIQYRLDEILEDSGSSSELSKESMTVFHYHDNSINMTGTIQGSNVAAGSSFISDSKSGYEVQQEVATELEEIRQQVAQKDETNSARQAALVAIEQLVDAASDPNASIELVRESACIAITSSPLAKGKLIDLIERIGVSVTSSVVAMGIKAALGI